MSAQSTNTQSTKDTAVRPTSVIEEILGRQRKAFLEGGYPDLATRRDRLDRLGAMIADHAEELAEAMTLDYGSRPKTLAQTGDLIPVLSEIRDQRAHLEEWMKESGTSRVRALAGIRAGYRNDPLGVVGIIGPWNFPIQLSLAPAAAALAAGNRVMVRPSSVTAHTTDVLARVAPAYFSTDELAIITSRESSGSEFAKLPFDHIFFTGSTKVGRSVALDAAANLIPATLELGGKNPTIVDADADVRKAAVRLAKSRMCNSGQVCLSPDYIFVPEDQVEPFVEQLLATWEEMFDTVLHNPDYTSIINEDNYQRITGLIDDAVAKGATKRQHVPPGEQLPDAQTRKIAPTVLLDVTSDMLIDDEEVFGPVLTVHSYRRIDDVISYLVERDSPLTLYWYGPRNDRFQRVVDQTRSGSVQGNDFCINMLAGLPFGGVGASGTGLYHGEFGFASLTHQRTISTSALPITIASVMAPPYGRIQRALTERILGTLRPKGARREERV